MILIMFYSTNLHNFINGKPLLKVKLENKEHEKLYNSKNYTKLYPLVQGWFRAECEILAGLPPTLNFPLLESDLLERSWLIHYALFYFKQPRVDPAFIDLAFGTCLNAIQIQCPSILIHLGFDLICKKRRSQLKEFIKLFSLETVENPIISFILELFQNVNIYAALAQLENCSQFVSNDFFCASHADTFFTRAKILIFEQLIKIQKAATLDQLARLGIPMDFSVLTRESRLELTFDNVFLFNDRILFR